MSSQRRLQDRKEGFRPVLQRPTTKLNLVSWSKPVSRRLQEEVQRKTLYIVAGTSIQK